jgi:hypothetical protein
MRPFIFDGADECAHSGGNPFREDREGEPRASRPAGSVVPAGQGILKSRCGGLCSRRETYQLPQRRVRAASSSRSVEFAQRRVRAEPSSRGAEFPQSRAPVFRDRVQRPLLAC